jgi:predicted GNAT family acetyltransferase
MDTVRNNTALSRYEMDVDGDVAFANYRLAPGTVIISHVETPRALRGRGIGARMVEGALRMIRGDGLKVVAGCSFARAYLAEHPEHHDLIA